MKFTPIMDSKYNYLEKISLEDTLKGNDFPYFNQTLAHVNGSMLRVGRFHGELPMHKHDDGDELFFVFKGDIIIETEKGNFALTTGEGVCVPKGVMHRPVSLEPSIVLMVENSLCDLELP